MSEIYPNTEAKLTRVGSHDVPTRQATRKIARIGQIMAVKRDIPVLPALLDLRIYKDVGCILNTAAGIEGCSSTPDHAGIDGPSRNEMPFA